MCWSHVASCWYAGGMLVVCTWASRSCRDVCTRFGKKLCRIAGCHGPAGPRLRVSNPNTNSDPNSYSYLPHSCPLCFSNHFLSAIFNVLCVVNYDNLPNRDPDRNPYPTYMHHHSMVRGSGPSQYIKTTTMPATRRCC